MPPGKREQQRQETRRHLLEAARRVYGEQGLRASSATIAREAGVSHGTVFVHFKTVEELITALVEKFGSSLMAAINGACAGQRTVSGVLEAHLSVLAEQEDFYTRLLEDSTHLPEEARYTLLAVQTVLSHHLSQALEPVDCPVPLHMVFNLWMGLVHHYLRNRDLFSPGEPVLPRCGRELVQSFTLLLSREGPQS